MGTITGLVDASWGRSCILHYHVPCWESWRVSKKCLVDTGQSREPCETDTEVCDALSAYD